VVREKVAREVTGSQWPTLTRTNYADWAVLMRVQLQVHGLWDAVNEDECDEHEDRAALSALLRAVPPELVRTLAAKDNAKAAWDMLRTLRVGAERVRDAKAQTRRREYDRLAFKEGESVEDFALRLSTILADLEILGDPEDEHKAVRKFLRVLPRKYRQMASSIESLLDIKQMSIEELCGRLLVVEENDALDIEGGSGQLLLTEEEWRSRQKQRATHDARGSGSGGDNRQPRNRGKGRDDRRPARDAGGAKRDDVCHYCGKKGHWARECRKKKREEEAHLVKEDDDADPAMLLAEIELDAHPPAPAPPPPAAATSSATAMEQRAPERALVFLNEEKSMVVPGRADERLDTTWYLDTGASNHMTGDRAVFATLDETITGNVRFGDGSVVQIRGRGTIAFCIDGGPQRAFSDVYYIPRLKSSVVSLGQLDELACDIRIRRGVLTILDRRDKLLLKVKRAPNRLYKLTMQPVQPVCLAMRKDTVPWRWHARFGHLHLEALQRMARNGMVQGLPAVEPTGELCEACLAGKQRRTPFPQQAKFRAEEPLELVHADLCGAITPPTPAGRRYFLLLVDDHSRFMWLVLLSTKDEAAAALKRFQAEAQTEARRQLRTLRTDRGGEFTSSTLAAHFADTGVKRHLTAPYSPQQNGVVERRNQTVVGMARSMMKAKNLPSFFWGEAVTTAVYVLNRSFTRSVEGKTPYEAWYGKKPSVEHLRVFGCVAHVKSARPLLRKLDDRSTPMIFIGYEPGSKAYRVYNPVTRRVHISRDVVFDEGESWDWSKDGSGAEDLGEEFVVEYTFAPNPTSRLEDREEGSEQTRSASPPATPAAPSPSQQDAAASPPPGVEFATPPAVPDPSLVDGEDDGEEHRYRRVSDLLGDDLAPPGRAEHLLLTIADEPSSVAEAL
jgi:transposase InsO family protein